MSIDGKVGRVRYLPRVVLVGPSKAGKTTVGRILAAKLGLSFRDTDEDVERNTAMSVAECFDKFGEAQFREWERAACLTALTEFEGVLSLGGGAILDERTQTALVSCGRVIHLAVSVEEALERTRTAKGVRVLPSEQIEKITRRVPLRVSAARSLGFPEVATEGCSPQAVASECIREMRRHGWM